MKRNLILLVAVVLSIGGDHVVAGDPVKDDLTKLKGTWVVVKRIDNGEEWEREAICEMKVLFADQKATLYNGANAEIEGTFTIDLAKKPKTIDITDGKTGASVPGIYQVDQDDLKLAFASAKRTSVDGKEKFEIGERPIDFDGKGDGDVFILKREKSQPGSHSDAVRGDHPASGCSEETLPFAGLAPAKELEVLAPVVGKWKMTERGSPSVRYKTGFASSGEMSTQWAHNRQFIRGEGYVVRTTDEQKLRVEFTSLMTYDRTNKVYRRWIFSSEGFVSESEGRWDESTSTMTWKPLRLPPNTTAESKSVLAKDRHEFNLLHKHEDGTILMAVTATLERK